MYLWKSFLNLVAQFQESGEASGTEKRHDIGSFSYAESEIAIASPYKCCETP